MELQLTVHTFFFCLKSYKYSFSTLNIVNLFLFSLVLCLQHPCVVRCFLKKGTYSSQVIFFFNVTLPDACKILQRDTNKLSLLSRAYSLNSHITNVIKMRIFIKVIVMLLISNTQLNWANSFTNCQQLQRCSEVGIQSKRGLGEQFNRSISSWKLPWLQRTALDYMCLFAI